MGTTINATLDTFNHSSQNQNSTFINNVNNDELYCPREILKIKNETVLSDHSTPNEKTVLVVETQMSPKPPAIPVPAPVLDISNIPSNHDINHETSFANTIISSQPPA